ncbi:LamG domain-containing protein [Candidatus Woesearchaeota archaeon]|nr:LamG domain-containing protein [Candidatus Woesearchaeota archaeon]
MVKKSLEKLVKGSLVSLGVGIGILGFNKYSSAQCRPFEADSATVGLWHLDEGSGDSIYDSSNLGNNGIIFNPHWLSDSFDGHALTFDDERSYVSIDVRDRLNLEYEVTVEAWVKLHSYNTVREIIGGRTFHFHVEGDKIKVFVPSGLESSGSLRSNTNLELERWYYLAATCDGRTTQLFINGVLDGAITDPDEISPLDHSEILYMGRCYWRPLPFPGVIDEIRISNIVRDIQPCDPATIDQTSWGKIKSLYR